MTRDSMSDKELDLLLGLSGDPAVPDGAEARLMARVKPIDHDSNIVRFRPRQKLQRSYVPWVAGLPLAASLAFGLWLGAAGVGTDILPESMGGGLAAAEDSVSSGIEDAEILAEDYQS